MERRTSCLRMTELIRQKRLPYGFVIARSETTKQSQSHAVGQAFLPVSNGQTEMSGPPDCFASARNDDPYHLGAPFPNGAK